MVVPLYSPITIQVKEGRKKRQPVASIRLGRKLETKDSL